MSGNSKYSKIYSRSPRLRRIHRRIEDALLVLAKIVLNTTLCDIVLVIETIIIPLKIADVISYSWIWVLSPVWIYTILFIVMYFIHKRIYKYY